MFIEILLAILLGVASGIITGLIPGIHVNLITAIVIGSAFLTSNINPLFIAIFIICLALTHSFLDSIPSIYLGCPDESHAVSALPGHKLLMQGDGHSAIVYTLVGSLVCLLLTILFFPIGFKVMQNVQDFIGPYVGKLLALIIFILLVKSGKFKLNFSFLLASGILGITCFALPIQRQILLPLLSGLFGVSTLILSLTGNDSIPKQNTNKTIDLEISDIEQTASRATIVGICASFLPGFGSSQAAIAATSTMKKALPKHYLLLTGGINTVNFSNSIITMAVLGKARNGAIVGVSNVLGDISNNQIFLFASILLTVGGIATILGIFLSKRAIKILTKLPYKILIKSIIGFLLFIVLVLSSFQGIVILAVATCLGILANHFKAQKNMLLGCLIIPVIINLW